MSRGFRYEAPLWGGEGEKINRQEVKYNIWHLLQKKKIEGKCGCSKMCQQFLKKRGDEPDWRVKGTPMTVGVKPVAAWIRPQNQSEKERVSEAIGWHGAAEKLKTNDDVGSS